MRLYNSLSRTVEDLVPVEPGLVKIYACGPTVYRSAHLGNLRTYMLGDLLRRALVLEGYRVTLVMNITDVGHMTDESSPEAVDKMLLATEDEGLSAFEIADRLLYASYLLSAMDEWWCQTVSVYGFGLCWSNDTVRWS